MNFSLVRSDLFPIHGFSLYFTLQRYPKTPYTSCIFQRCLIHSITCSRRQSKHDVKSSHTMLFHQDCDFLSVFRVCFPTCERPSLAEFSSNKKFYLSAKVGLPLKVSQYLGGFSIFGWKVFWTLFLARRHVLQDMLLLPCQFKCFEKHI